MSTAASAQIAWFPRPRFGRPALSAGMIVLMGYLFAGLPVQIGVLTQLGLTAEESSSWFFITWLTTGVFSVVVALVTRQPVSINLSISSLVFLAGAASGFSLPQILGANLAVGAVAIVLSILRLTERATRLVPAQIAIGVFAGSIVAFMIRTLDIAIHDLAISGPVMAGYFLALILTRSNVVAVAMAAISGILGIIAAGGLPGSTGAIAFPQTSLPSFDFDPVAILALGGPILVLTVGIANIQAFAILRSEGYKVKADLLGLVAGLATVVNALGGGHAAAVGGATMVLATGPAAGPERSRYWAIILSSVPVVMVALIAVPVITLVRELPLSFAVTVGALALVPALRAVLKKTVQGPMRSGAVVAFIIAALPMQVGEMPMLFWGLLAGIAVSAALDRQQMVRSWFPRRALSASTRDALGGGVPHR